MPRVSTHLQTIRNADAYAISLRTSTIRSALNNVTRLTFDFVRSPESKARLQTRRDETIKRLRSAMVEATRMEHETSNTLDVTSSDLVQSQRVLSHDRAMELVRHYYRAIASNTHLLSASMVRALVWTVGYHAARHAMTFHEMCSHYDYDPHFDVVTPLAGRERVHVPNISLLSLSAATMDERGAQFERLFPKVLYAPVHDVSTTIWPFYNTQPASCARCGGVHQQMLEPSSVTFDTTSYGMRRLYCGPCSVASRCATCDNTNRSSVYPIYTVPNHETLSATHSFRYNDLIPTGTFTCLDCASDTDQLSRVSVAGSHRYVPTSVADRMVLPVIQPYSHQPRYVIHGAPNERIASDSLTFGMELECGFKVNPREAEWYVERLAAADIYFKRDGSVQNGIEVITHPFTFRYWKEVGFARWIERLEAMKALGMRSYNYPNCGIHIHMAKAAFSVAQTKRLLDLVYGNPDLFAKLSQRDIFDYCRLQDPDRATPEMRLKRAVASVGSTRPRQMNRTRVVAFMAAGLSRSSERRTAVNFPDTKPTIELRLFRGTLHAPSVAKNVELCHALHAFTAESRGDDITMARDFISFVYDNDKLYNNLAAFIDRWYRKYRPVARQVPPQYVVLRPPVKFEDAVLVAEAN
jgi:hypothetical protein